MLTTGIDLIAIARLDETLSRHGERFSQRCFTEGERRACGGRSASLAARFAAKEAVAKALGTGIGDVGWTDIEVVNDERGRPNLVLHGPARALAESLGLHTWAISLSHTETHAIAVAVANGDPPPPYIDPPTS